MKLRFFVLALLLLLTVQRSQAAPAVTGVWLDQAGDGIIAISSCGSGVCARIVGFFVDRPDARTPVSYRGVSQCNLPLVTDARQIRPGLWKGHITDPRNGTVWGVELHLDPHGNLALHGFLFIPLLGRTQIWHRYTGPLPADCRIMSSGAGGRHARTLPNRANSAQ